MFEFSIFWESIRLNSLHLELHFNRHVAFQQARLFSSDDLQREITTSCSRTRCSAIIFVHGVVLSRNLIFAAQPLRYPCHVLVMACDMGFHSHRTVQRAACPFSFREISYHWRADGRFFCAAYSVGSNAESGRHGSTIALSTTSLIIDLRSSCTLFDRKRRYTAHGLRP